MKWSDILIWPAIAGGVLVAAPGLAWFAPETLWPPLIQLLAAFLLGLVAAYPAQATALWLAVLATCPKWGLVT
jgi:hypothetical protein